MARRNYSAGASASSSSSAPAAARLKFPYVAAKGKYIPNGTICFTGTVTLEFLTDQLGVPIEKIAENTANGSWNFRDSQESDMVAHYGAEKAAKIVAAFDRPVQTRSSQQAAKQAELEKALEAERAANAQQALLLQQAMARLDSLEKAKS